MKYHKIAILESQRISLIHKLSSLTEENLRFKYSDSQWNIVEIIEHLIISEEVSLQYVQKKIASSNELVSVSHWSGVKTILMNLYLRFNFKAKAPKFTKPRNSIKFSLEELAKRWEKNRRLLETLSEQPKELLSKGVFKHPKVGVMNFEQMVAFFCAHKTHHLKQINALLMAKEITGESLEFVDVSFKKKTAGLKSI